MKRNIPIVLSMVATMLCGVNFAYAVTNANNEISTAIMHANYANQASSLEQAQLHLRHVIGCLVGDQGDKTVSRATNPCLGMGHGAINDFKGDKVNRDMLKQALMDAQFGLQTKRLKIAKNAADLARKSLKEAEMHI